ncbi:type II secretion system protein [Paenisporosarcina quisquiliarum]|uniref:type II secretion system protein n=1 Tax=Paenisporosarcina quisquiliarum TaxID=365346 RepID=UPI0037365E38
MRKWLKHLKNQKGLTLIELLAVVVILGIIAAIAVPAIGNIINNSKDDAHRSNALLIINAAKLGIVSGEVTSTMLDTNNQISLDELVAAGVLDGLPADPSVDGKTYKSSSFVAYTPASNSTGAKYLITLQSDETTAKTYYYQKTETEINAGADPTP